MSTTARNLRSACIALAVLALALACESEEATCTALPTFTLSAPAIAPTTAGSAIQVEIRRSGTACAYAGGGADIKLETLGGGSVSPATLTVPEAGAKLVWTLGPAPIRQTLSVVGTPDAQLALTAEVAAPVVPQTFGDVHAFLLAEGITSTTEDLAIAADGTIALGVDGAVIEVRQSSDGKVTISKRKLSGDPLPRAHGLAYDRQGTLWTADPAGGALHAIAKDGTVKTHLTAVEGTPLDGPNDVAVDPGDRVLLSDPCRGELYYYDPKAGKVTDIEPFDLLTEGGPNGFAFQGDTLYVVTENTTLLCPKAKKKPPVTANLAALFRLSAKDGVFGPRTLVEGGLGVFGDGMAFDALGNLYVIVDTIANVAIDESRVMVLRAGESKLVPFVAFKKSAILANVAFGRGPLGDTTMFAALLAIPPFTAPVQRGLVRFEVGVKGLALLP